MQSVDRAVSILQVLARRGNGGVTEISKDLAIHKSTVSRLLLTLEARGLVEQDTSRGRYRLGYGVVQLARGANANRDLAEIGRSIINGLAGEVGETVHIVGRAGMEIVTVDQSVGSSSISVVKVIGHRDPLYPTAAGKVFLADLTVPEQRALLGDHPPVRYTPHTIVDVEAYLAGLHAARERGYATSFEEMEIGLVAVAAPIRGFDGNVEATVVVSGPAFRLTPARMADITPKLMSGALQISERNGFPKSG
ncbi:MULTISPECIES: IclR family transcriptional regulator [Microbacterium]|uniref:IclR family transcriptional regulator n=1 Tax=Microbacterium TaxID=33882 RepID=UPI000D646A7D|nr:IclR family transcriptional regulator [Microbacterium sp. KCTC 39802]